jgi:hypothetical protein
MYLVLIISSFIIPYIYSTVAIAITNASFTPPPEESIVIVLPDGTSVIFVPAARVTPPERPFIVLTILVRLVPDPENPTVEDTRPVKFAVVPCNVPARVTPPEAEIPALKVCNAIKLFAVPVVTPVTGLHSRIELLPSCDFTLRTSPVTPLD